MNLQQQLGLYTENRQLQASLHKGASVALDMRIYGPLERNKEKAMLAQIELDTDTAAELAA